MSIIKEDLIPRHDISRQRLVSRWDHAISTLDSGRCNDHLLPGNKFLTSAAHQTGADFGALQITKNGNCLLMLIGKFSNLVNPTHFLFQIPMRKIQPKNVHPGL